MIQLINTFGSFRLSQHKYNSANMWAFMVEVLTYYLCLILHGKLLWRYFCLQDVKWISMFALFLVHFQYIEVTLLHMYVTWSWSIMLYDKPCRPSLSVKLASAWTNFSLSLTRPIYFMHLLNKWAQGVLTSKEKHLKLHFSMNWQLVPS